MTDKKVQHHDSAHGANRVLGSTKKKGGNKGILAAKRERKRIEAEERNARTLPENRRQYRLAQEQ